tara:strand:+ start:86 stop:556 length:471 start_codon:yes stop_codon:yes gene_type:complete
MANINGWGRGTWGQLTFGEPLPVPVTGLVGTSALDNGTAVQAAAVTGVSAVASTLSVGDETVTADANVPITLATATATLGTQSLITNNFLDVTGFGLSIPNPTVTPTADANVTIETTDALVSGFSGVNVWGTVVDTQNPNYSIISTTQSPNWSDVA